MFQLDLVGFFGVTDARNSVAENSAPPFKQTFDNSTIFQILKIFLFSFGFCTKFKKKKRKKLYFSCVSPFFVWLPREKSKICIAIYKIRRKPAKRHLLIISQNTKRQKKYIVCVCVLCFKIHFLARGSYDKWESHITHIIDGFQSKYSFPVNNFVS